LLCSSQSNVVEDHIELHKIQFLQKIIELLGIQFCFELYIVGNHHFFGLWSGGAQEKGMEGGEDGMNSVYHKN
jgi:hypothetical protein